MNWHYLVLSTFLLSCQSDKEESQQIEQVEDTESEDTESEDTQDENEGFQGSGEVIVDGIFKYDKLINPGSF